jgi:hypothetical protein
VSRLNCANIAGTDVDRALIQVILLLAFIPLHTPVVKKRKKGRRDEPDAKQASPLDDPKAALETLLDRLSIWSAMADLNLGDSGNGKGKAKEGEGWTGILQRFWNDILVPSQVFWYSTSPMLTI